MAQSASIPFQNPPATAWWYWPHRTAPSYSQANCLS